MSLGEFLSMGYPNGHPRSLEIACHRSLGELRVYHAETHVFIENPLDPIDRLPEAIDGLHPIALASQVDRSPR